VPKSFNVRYLPGRAAVNFGREADTPTSDQSRFYPISGVKMIHPYWDFALLSVQGVEGAPLGLSTVPPEALDGSEVVVVGYPARDSRTDLDVQDRIFAGIYGVKRMMPGVIRSREKVRSFENIVTTLTHDAWTAGGCGGAPVIQVATGEVVGIHFASEYLRGKYAVPAFELARDKRVAALLNFIGQLPAPTDEWEHAWSAVGGSAGENPSVT
jgi:endonuclease G